MAKARTNKMIDSGAIKVTKQKNLQLIFKST